MEYYRPMIRCLCARVKRKQYKLTHVGTKISRAVLMWKSTFCVLPVTFHSGMKPINQTSVSAFCLRMQRFLWSLRPSRHKGWSKNILSKNSLKLARIVGSVFSLTANWNAQPFYIPRGVIHSPWLMKLRKAYFETKSVKFADFVLSVPYNSKKGEQCGPRTNSVIMRKSLFRFSSDDI